jgi:hypothetical protein
LHFLGGCGTISLSQLGEPEMRSIVRFMPWLLALTGLAILLVAGGFVVWPLIALWLAVLALIWSVGRAGLWLIPADIAWLLIEVTDRSQASGEPIGRDATV